MSRPRTRVVNRHHEDYEVYIGRGTMWGNPFHVGVHGSRTEVIARYEEYLREKLEENTEITRQELLALDGAVLGCSCKPRSCHGDVIVKLIEELKNEARK